MPLSPTGAYGAPPLQDWERDYIKDCERDCTEMLKVGMKIAACVAACVTFGASGFFLNPIAGICTSLLGIAILAKIYDSAAPIPPHPFYWALRI